MKPYEIEEFKFSSEKKNGFKNCDPSWNPKWAQKKKKDEGKKAVKQQALAYLTQNRHKLAAIQELFWANDNYAMLIVLQGMDAAGKDGAIRHVMSGVNPQGCRVTGFKTPTQEDLDHNFLWRYSKELPERGSIGIFNRSYYEEVLIDKVRPEILAKQKLPNLNSNKSFWEQRYEDINMFERHLTRNATIILKFFLNISKDEQKKRLLKRLEDPQKHWKFSLSDISERSKWSKYMEAYEEMLNQTSTKWAPWYVIPSDRKWVARGLISEIIVTKIEELNLRYPELNKEQMKILQEAKTRLEKE